MSKASGVSMKGGIGVWPLPCQSAGVEPVTVLVKVVGSKSDSGQKARVWKVSQLQSSVMPNVSRWCK